MATKFCISLVILLVQIAVGCENVCDGSSISVLEIPDYLSNGDITSTSQLFNCTFCASNADVSITICSNVAMQLLSEAQRNHANIRIISQTLADKYLSSEKEYRLIIQPIDCGEFVNILPYPNYQSVVQQYDYNISGIINKTGILTHDSSYFNLDLTSSRIVKKYDQIMNGKKTNSLIKHSLLTAPTVNGIIIKACDSLNHHQNKVMTLTNIINHDTPNVSKIQIDWIDCKNGDYVKSHCYDPLLSGIYHDENNNKVQQIYIDLNSNINDYDNLLKRRQQRSLLIGDVSDSSSDSTDESGMTDSNQQSDSEDVSMEQQDIQISTTNNDGEINSIDTTDGEETNNEQSVAIDSNPFQCGGDDFCYFSFDMSTVCACQNVDGFQDLDQDLICQPFDETLLSPSTFDESEGGIGNFVLSACDFDCDIEDLVLKSQDHHGQADANNAQTGSVLGGDNGSGGGRRRLPTDQVGLLTNFCSCSAFKCDEEAATVSQNNAIRIYFDPISLLSIGICISFI